MEKKLSPFQHLTENSGEAMTMWQNIVSGINKIGRIDILQNPSVLDMGGGMGEFSKYLNTQGIKCVSLDSKDLSIESSASPIRGNAYQMPFADRSFSIVYGRGVFDSNISTLNYEKP